MPPLLPRSLSATSGNEAALLGPGAGVTAFVGRGELLASFVNWAKSHSPERPVSVRVVHGGAGVGKTRFAMELCRALGPGWQAGFVDGTEARRFSRQANLADWGWQAPTLIVFDYALTLLDVLPDWMDELCAIPESAQPLRIVLLERQAGEGQGSWLERAFPRRFGISGVCPADLLDGEPLRLLGMADCVVQRGIMQDMLTRLGSGLVLPPNNDAFRDRLARTDWAGAPLYLMMAAMVMHRQGGMGEVLHLGRADLAHAVAGHELERLRRACQGGQASRGSLELFLPHMAALTTLSGGLPEGLVSDCLRREKVAVGCESLDTGVVKRNLTELLPDEGRGGIASIRPDIVGEAFVLAHLGNGQASDGQRAVLRAFADHPAEVAAVLVRCVQDFAPRGASAASAREAQDQERALDWLRAVGEIPDLPLPWLLLLHDELPETSEAILNVAIAIQQRVVCVLRDAPGTIENRSKLAGSLNNLSIRFSQIGKGEAAIDAAREAVSIRRELATVNFKKYLPDLALSLNTLANRLSQARRRKEALIVIAKAVSIRRKLAAEDPSSYLPILAHSLNNFSIMLSKTRHKKESLRIAREATQIYSSLENINNTSRITHMTASLNTLSNRLKENRLYDESYSAAQHAVDVLYPLSSTMPDIFLSRYAGSLNTIADRLKTINRHSEAIKCAQNSVTIFRKLVHDGSNIYNSNIAMSLCTLAECLSYSGMQKDALRPACEAAVLYQKIMTDTSNKFTEDFIYSIKLWLSLRHGISRKEASFMFRQDPETHIRVLLEDADADDPPSPPAP